MPQENSNNPNQLAQIRSLTPALVNHRSTLYLIALPNIAQKKSKGPQNAHARRQKQDTTYLTKEFFRSLQISKCISLFKVDSGKHANVFFILGAILVWDDSKQEVLYRGRSR